MNIDWTLKITDIATVAAVLFSPLIAVQVTEWIRRRQEARTRKIHLFRTLMSTRASTLAPTHVEALNLIDIEFGIDRPEEKRVVDAWKLYHSHLNDSSYPHPAWTNRQIELLIDLLYEMAACLGYRFDKAHIKNSSYYPRGFGETEEEQQKLRRAILAAFAGNGALRVVAPSAGEVQTG